VLVTSLWLGFDGRRRRGMFVAGLIVPAGFIGITAWSAAWSGQRSQFGYSDASRADYLPAENAGPAFHPLRGLKLPPDLMLSLELIEHTLPDLDAHGRRPVFYGPGLEFLDRVYPSQRRSGSPLWFHVGTSYGPAEIARLGHELARPDFFDAVLVLQAYDEWPAEIRATLERDYFGDLTGPRIRRWNRRDANKVNLADTIETLTHLGGNVDGRMLHLGRQPLRIVRASDGRLVLGTTRETGNVLLKAPSYRLGGKAVVSRLAGTEAEPLVADFKVIVHGADPEDVRWSGRVELPAGEQSVTAPFLADGHGKGLLIWISTPHAMTGRVVAGVRDLEITHSYDLPGEAPRLRDGVRPAIPVTPEMAQSFFGTLGWRPEQLAVRGGWATDQGLALPPGGEIWFRTEGMTGVVNGQLICPDVAGSPAFVRVIWCKGARVQILQQGFLSREAPLDFRAWTAEPGGWIGIVVEDGANYTHVVARVLETTLTP
jgi:hypothetical protein